MKKTILVLLFALGLVGFGFEVVHHESKTVVEKIGKIGTSNVAYAQSLDRGFADLVKRVIPGVVNISTYARPRMINPYGMGGQDEMFQRFFEEFFGGRVPGGPMPGVPQSPQGPKSSKAMPVALGTGFIIDANEGLILTNNHVIQGAEEVKVQFREEDTDLTPAEVIGKDPELDVALLKVKTKKLVAIPMGDSDSIEVGEYVLAIGNPLGYGHTVSHGILSAKGRRNPEFKMGRYLQTDASINPGNSGGPLINTKGEVIGINNAIDARAHGIGFAIPMNLVKAILPQLKQKGSVSRGYLGVSAADLTPEIAEQLNMDSKLKGVIVSDVNPAAPAEKAGLKPYDVITAINGEKITNSQDLTAKVTSVAIGEKVKLEIVRAGKAKTLEVNISERPVAGMVRNDRGSNKGPNRGTSISIFPEFGFQVRELSAQNSQEFGIPAALLGGKRVVVVSDLEYGKAAANSGLSRGDIVLDVANQEVKTVSDLEKIMKTVKGSSLMMRVKRFDSMGNEFVSVVVLAK